MDPFWQTKDDPFSFMDPSAMFGELLFANQMTRAHCVSILEVLYCACTLYYTVHVYALRRSSKGVKKRQSTTLSSSSIAVTVLFLYKYSSAHLYSNNSLVLDDQRVFFWTTKFFRHDRLVL